MSESLSTVDLIIIVLFIVFIIWWALRHSKTSDSASYFLAGKSCTWPMIGLSLFAASISSSTLIGHAGEGSLVAVAVFNYNLMAVFVMIFFAMFFLPFYIKSVSSRYRNIWDADSIAARDFTFHSLPLSEIFFWMRQPHYIRVH